MGFVGRASTVAAAARASRGRHPLGARIVAIAPMLRDAFTGRWKSAPHGRLVAGLAGIAYVLSPIDLLPEILLGPFGLGDDLAIAVVSLAALMASAEDWLDHRDTVDLPTFEGTAGVAGDVIPGVVIDRR